MFDQKERKMERLNQIVDFEISTRLYNTILGLCIFYGLLINALIVFFAADTIANMNYILILVGYFVSVLVGSGISRASKNPLVSFIGYNLICAPMGVLLTLIVGTYQADIIVVAFLLTAIISLLITVSAATFPEMFAKLGKALFVSLIISIIVEIVAILILGLPTMIIDIVVVVIFTLYLGYDISKAQMYPKTVDNAIDSAIDIYVDIINLFIRILRILNSSKSKR